MDRAGLGRVGPDWAGPGRAGRRAGLGPGSSIANIVLDYINININANINVNINMNIEIDININININIQY